MIFVVMAGMLRKTLMPVVTAAVTRGRREYCDAGKLTLTVDGSGLLAQANNGYLAVETRSDVEAERDGMTTVNAVDFWNSLKSFPADALLQLSLQIGHQLVIEWLGNGDSQSLLTMVQPVAAGCLAQPSGRSFTLRRQDLLSALSTSRAAGADRRWPLWHEMVLRIRPNHLRAAAGNGTRFVVFEKQGIDLLRTEGDFDINLYRTWTRSIINVLTGTASDEVTCAITPDGSLSMTGGATRIVIPEGSRGHTWPDEAKYLNRTGQLCCTLSLDELKRKLSGFAFLKSEPFGLVEIRFDTVRQIVAMEAAGSRRAQLKLTMLDLATRDPGSPVAFACPFPSLRDIATFASKMDQHVQLEFLHGEKPVLFVQYGAGERIEANLWQRDIGRMTRERRATFLRVKNVTQTQ